MSRKGMVSGVDRHVQVVRAVAKVTFAEILRDKILYNAIVISILLFFVALLASRLAVLQPGRMLVDFGASALIISTSLTAVLLGAGMIGKEISQRTMSICLSHPIHRIQFIWGKFVGLAQILILNWALQCLVFMFLVWAFVDASLFTGTFYWSLFLTLIQSFLMGALALFFSSFSTTSLAVVCSVGIALIGSNMNQLRLLADKIKNDFAELSLRFFTVILPDIEAFHLKLQLTYGLPVPFLQVVLVTTAAMIWVVMLVSLSGILITLREA